MDADVIFFFVERKGKKIQKNDKNSSNWGSKNSYLLRDLMTFNEISAKKITYDDIKSDKTHSLTLFPDSIFFETYS